MPPALRVFRTSLIFVATLVLLRAEPLRVGIDVNGEPMTFVDTKGVPSGFAVDIMNAIASEMDFKVEYSAKPWADMYGDFQAGRLDALANITFTGERAASIDFSVPHIVMKGAIFMRKNDPLIRTPADLGRLRVSVKIGSAPHAYLVAHHWLNITVPEPTLRGSLRAVAENRADATMDARIIGLKHIRDDKLTSLVAADIDVPEFAQRLHIGLQRGDSARLAVINEGLARLHTNGTYDRIYEKWIGPLEPSRIRLRDLMPYLWPVTAVILVIVGALIWQRRLLLRLERQATALHLSEEQLSLVLEGTEDGFWDWDIRTGNITRSERWAAMLGYTLAEIEPTIAGGLKLVHPEDRPAYEALFRQPERDSTRRYDVEYRMRTKGGEWRWILKRGKIVARTADGQPIRMAGTQTDITDLKHTREALIRQENQFRFIYEHVPVGLSWMRSRQPDTRLVNAAHQRITGVTQGHGHDPASYYNATHPDDRERQWPLMEKLRRGELPHFSLEKRYVHADGRLVWAMFTMHLFRDPITNESLEVTTLADITELKRAEEEREKMRLKMVDSQKLESLGVLAGGIAHDFNNLLTVVLANASVMHSEPEDRQNHPERIAQIETAARRAADLCHQMLAYAGGGNFLIERIDLTALVNDTAKLLRISISKKAQLVLSLAADLPPVEADATQIQQVVMNLVINASDALGENSGEIALTTELGRPQISEDGVLHAFDLPEGECICLEVRDTGQGMTPATLARVFDPFFTTKFAGRGLGLAAVLGIVRAHHGALSVESSPGQGTRFQLFLPSARSAPAPSSRPATAAPISVRPVEGTILIADDEPAVLSIADKMLRRHGYQTVLATDGNAVVNSFRANPQGFAAILLDLTMPGLDGAESLRAIRSLNPKVPVLLMSGYTEQDVLLRIQDLGPVPVLRKPFTLDSLLGSLAEAIAG